MLPEMTLENLESRTVPIEQEEPPETASSNGHSKRNTKRRFSREQIFKFFKLVDEKKFTIKELSLREGFGMSTYSNWRKTLGEEYANSLWAADARPAKEKRGGRKSKANTVTLTDQLRDFKAQKAAVMAEAEQQCAKVNARAQAQIDEINKKIIALTETV